MPRPFGKQRSVRELLRAVSNFGANEDAPVDVGPSLVLATMRTDSKMTTRIISTKDLTADDVIILLMGSSGSGKTTFIEIAGGNRGVVRRQAITYRGLVRLQEPIAYRVSVSKFLDSNIVLVDLPAFNDTDEPDIEILNMICDWVNLTYKKGILISGMVYFHRISDKKMEGTPLRNWRAFEKICGEGFNKVVLTTTMWNNVDDEEGYNRERELEDFWRPSMERGASMRRFLHERSSAAEILAPILVDITKRPLRLQREIVDFNMTIKQTTAARILFLELETLLRECKRNLVTIRDNLKNPSLNKQELTNLETKYERSSSLLKRVTAGLKDLKAAPSDRLQRLTLMTEFNMMTRFPSALGRLGSSMRKQPESLAQMDARGDQEDQRHQRSDVIMEEDETPYNTAGSAGGGDRAQIRQIRRVGHLRVERD